MKVAVIQSNYIPWKGYFDIINDVDVFCFYDEVKYTKNDWRNRNKIYSRNGLQWLTIPIYKEAVKEKISEVKLKNDSWQNLHYSSLVHCYSKAPHFSELAPFLEDFYKNKSWEFLSEFNQYSIKKIAEFLGISTRFVNSAQYDLRGNRIERLLNLLADIGATEYVSGPSAKEYLNGCENLFRQKNIKLIFKNYSHYASYPQMKTPFENNVSIVDIIANIKKEEIGNYIYASEKR